MWKLSKSSAGLSIRFLSNSASISTPIVLVENLMYEGASLDENLSTLIHEKNKALQAEYEQMIENGFNNILYISHQNALGNDHEGTVDGVHFTDLGFSRYAEFLIKKFEQFGITNHSH